MPNKTMLFNPYTGKPRDPRDIASDPSGLLMIDPSEPVRAAPSHEGEDARDAARLEWMIFHSAVVTHTRDGEYCRVRWVEDNEDKTTEPFGNARDALDAARAGGSQ